MFIFNAIRSKAFKSWCQKDLNNVVGYLPNPKYHNQLRILEPDSLQDAVFVLASCYNLPELCEIGEEFGLDLNAILQISYRWGSSWNTLRLAAALGSRDTVEFLMEKMKPHGAFQVDELGNTLCHLAAAEGHLSVVQLFQERFTQLYPDYFLILNKRNRNALEFAVNIWPDREDDEDDKDQWEVFRAMYDSRFLKTQGSTLIHSILSFRSRKFIAKALSLVDLKHVPR